jgi:hypothetical protein
MTTHGIVANNTRRRRESGTSRAGQTESMGGSGTTLTRTPRATFAAGRTRAGTPRTSSPPAAEPGRFRSAAPVTG